VIEALLKIIARLIEIKKGRIQSRKQVFDMVLQPTFDDLLAVHGDYIKMFQQLMVFAGDQRPSVLAKRIAKAKEQLQKNRLEFEPIRENIRVVARQLAKRNLPGEETEFVSAVLQYFPSGEPLLPHSSATTLLKFLGRDLTGSAIDMLVIRTIESHKRRWSDVCTAFASLKIAVAGER
jgi:hypothetical protein